MSIGRRRAHIPKHVGSNPAPATNLKKMIYIKNFVFLKSAFDKKAPFYLSQTSSIRLINNLTLTKKKYEEKHLSIHLSLDMLCKDENLNHTLNTELLYKFTYKIVNQFIISSKRIKFSLEFLPKKYKARIYLTLDLSDVNVNLYDLNIINIKKRKQMLIDSFVSLFENHPTLTIFQIPNKKDDTIAEKMMLAQNERILLKTIKTSQICQALIQHKSGN